VYSIQPVEIGRRMADTALFLYHTDAGKPLQIVYRLWVLRSAQDTILVDTGPPLKEAARRGITEVRAVEEALAEAGVDAAEIRKVLLTHLHWDHASNAEHFPLATFHAQQSEIDFFRSQRRQHPAFHRFFSDQAMLPALIDGGRIRPIAGDIEFAPGLRTLRVGGHTPGSQMLIVDTAEGRCLLTGDAVPLHRNYLDNIPSGIIVDMLEAVAAIERVRELDPVAIYTGHDVEPRLLLRPH